MTLQEIFNRVWDYYLTQNKPPGVDLAPPMLTFEYSPQQNRCVYRSEDGTQACAVGQFFPAEIKTDKLNRGSVATLAVIAETGAHPKGTEVYAEELADIRAAVDWLRVNVTDDWDFLSRLQTQHDMAALQAIGHPNALHETKLLTFRHVLESNLRAFAADESLEVPA